MLQVLINMFTGFICSYISAWLNSRIWPVYNHTVWTVILICLVDAAHIPRVLIHKSLMFFRRHLCNMNGWSLKCECFCNSHRDWVYALWFPWNCTGFWKEEREGEFFMAIDLFSVYEQIEMSGHAKGLTSQTTGCQVINNLTLQSNLN